MKNRNITTSIETLVRKAMKAEKVPGAAVAVIRGDEVVFLEGFGVREMGREEAVTTETLFAIASTTKAMTTTVLAMLVDDDKMEWDDPVRKHIPFFRLSDPLADQNVTIRDIVTHRTGLSRNDMLWYGSPWGREEILKKIGLVRLNASFRSLYQYQNIMYLAAGYAAGLAAGSSWEDVMRERLFLPLGMNGANFSTADAEKAPDHATPHRKATKTGKIEVVPAWRNLDNCAPGGGVNAGIADMARWLRFLLGGGEFEGKRLVSEKNLRETWTPQTVVRMDDTARALYPETIQTSYAMGWSCWDYRGRHLLSHGGALDGFRSQVAIAPREKVGVAVLANLGPTNLHEIVRNGLLDLLLDLPPNNWQAAYTEQAKKAKDEQKQKDKERREKRHKRTKPSRDLCAYAGDYEEPAYETATVALEDGALHLRWANFTSPLKHIHFDTFEATATDNPLEGQQVLFTLGADGDIAAIRFFDQEFRRAKQDKEASK